MDNYYSGHVQLAKMFEMQKYITAKEYLPSTGYGWY